MLKIAVCIKQIPLIEDANFDPVTKTIKRDGPNVISAFDLRAIALAIELKNRFGAETTAVTMGPPQARSALVEAMAAGIDRAVHLEDRAFAGADTLATARALALWLKAERFDLILLGKCSLDAETGQVGPEIAEMLGIPHVTAVRKLELDGETIRAERESDEGFDEVECRIPALLTCAERVAQPIKVKPGANEQAKSKPIEVVRAAALDPDLSHFGAAGSPTWVLEVMAEEIPPVNVRFIELTEDAAAAADEIVTALDKLGALTAGANQRRPVSPAPRTSARGKDVWVACETNHTGQITRASLELLSRGGELAEALGGALAAIGTGEAIERHASLLASYGADLIFALQHPGLIAYTPESTAAAIAWLVRQHQPWGLIVPASERGRDWAPRLAARLDLGLTGDAIGIELNQEERMVALKPAFGGNIVAPILCRTDPQMVTVRPGVLELAQPDDSRRAALQVLRPELPPALSALIRSHFTLDESIAPLEGTDVVVGVGTGVGGPDGVEQVKELARVLNAGIAATRRVTDAGWLPRQLQVGLTGKAIDPRLYFAIGIRGAPNHTVGLKRARTIVAINNDPEAPIFERATLGVVADYAVIVPALTEALRRRLGAPFDPATE
ncbi:MAG TPA: FAD-binding protein [Candidatus Binataceae bacterium]|nr:FAD-binding protein [Candidatus Binataceae bacterium]